MLRHNISGPVFQKEQFDCLNVYLFKQCKNLYRQKGQQVPQMYLRTEERQVRVGGICRGVADPSQRLY